MFGEIRDNASQVKDSKIERKGNVYGDKTFITHSEETKRPPFSNKMNCPCCGKPNHELDNCFFFLRKSLNEREEYVRLKKLCFGCLRFSNHRSRECKSRIKCKTCNGLHPSSLHNDRKTAFKGREEQNIEKEPVQAFNTRNADDRKIMCPCVPVKIRKRNTSDFIVTYMAMDPYSTACYMDEHLMKKLNLQWVQTSLSLTTMDSRPNTISVKCVSDLEICSLTGKERAVIKTLYAKSLWPFDVSDAPTVKDIKNIQEFEEIPFQFVCKQVGILIGSNEPDVIKPRDIIHTTKNGSYATRHLFGWALNGPTVGVNCRDHCFRIKVKNETENDGLSNTIENYFARDFDENDDFTKHSINDIKWNQIVSTKIKKLPSGNYEIPLPWKRSNFTMPNNMSKVEMQLRSLRRKLLSNEDFYQDYKTFMKEMRDRDFVEPIPSEEINATPGKVWYIPHHGVYHKQKNKLRVVFNCSAIYDGHCLNDELLQGPDLTNNLVGVLIRFREGKVSFCGDIEKMFYMVKVPKEDSNFLRFLWYPNDDLDANPIQFRLKVHVFGAKSSPSIANFALKQCLINNENKLDSEIVSKGFYVDDLMVSVNCVKRALNLLDFSKNKLRESGFNLTGFCSNSRAVLSHVQKADLSKNLKEVKEYEELPQERTLGLKWDAETDTIRFSVNLRDNPDTKRGMLSTIFSVYDPFFITSPVIVKGKSLFQEACQAKITWDDSLPVSIIGRWHKWLSDLKNLDNFKIDRCIIRDLNDTKLIELHIFADGSELAYGCVAYLRITDVDGKVKSNILLAKVRLVPLKQNSLKTIPRIELNAAKLAVILYKKIEVESNFKFSKVHFWSDSSIVLSYIYAEDTRFHRFVMNRVAFIRSHTETAQWHHVPGNSNPADLISRGSDVCSFIANQMWLCGPKFLSQSSENWPANVSFQVDTNDSELKREDRAKTMHVANSKTESSTNALLLSSSNWYKIQCRVATILRLADALQHKPFNEGQITLKELKSAKLSIFRYLQRTNFQNVWEDLNRNVEPRKTSLVKLNPYLDENGVLRVGGRLKNCQLPLTMKHPIILPKNHHISRLITEDYHRSLGHLGREALLANVRLEYHIVGINKLARSVVKDCLICRKIHSQPINQLMSDLPEDRVCGDVPPFSRVGVDYFGPYLVFRGRGKAKEKRYGVIFSCLTSRACHIEIAHSLDTDGFINALRRFIARRGSVDLIRSDNGTNLVAGCKELKIAINNWNLSCIDNFCKQKQIEWIFNPPNASHYGGVYEREIRTVRKVLNSLLYEFSNQILFTDEILSTLMCEVECVLNSRPLTCASSNPDDLEALTPNHLLTLRSTVNLPPGTFTKCDGYTRRRWKVVQMLADLFWKRWKREYLTSLISRQKWFTIHRKYMVDDLVLLVDSNLPRNLWSLGRIVRVNEASEGRVRSLIIKVNRFKEGKSLKFGTTDIERPPNKVVLLKSCENLT